MATSSRKVLVVVGSTASGKSAVALAAALKIKGEIVNADSRQIYKYLAAGTAQPAPSDKKAVPHHLYDFLDPKLTYNAGDYCKDAQAVIEQILQRGNVPIVAGGTGLYIRALLDGLSPLPQKNEPLRNQLMELAQKKGKEHLHAKLKEVDPGSAEKIPYQNIHRVVRALEVYTLTGKPLSYWHRQTTVDRNDFQAVFWGLRWQKEDLKKRILNRSKNILSSLIDETRRLLENGYTESDPGLQSLGYKKASEFIQKKISYDELFASLVRDTLHYAKRQTTWFKKNKDISWIELKEPFRPAETAEQIARAL